jgi:hypothetical protein
LPAQPARRDNDQRGRERGNRPATTHPASDRDDSGTTGKMAAMFDRLRAAAAEHDIDYDYLPFLLHDDADTSDQLKR